MNKKEEWSPVALKPVLDHLKKMPESAYEELRPYVELGTKKRNDVILAPGHTEIESRLILKGIVGKYLQGALIRLYVEGDICMEMDSYAQQVASRFELRVIQDCTFSRLSYKNESIILDRHPHFTGISEELYRLARHKEEEWMAIRRLPYKEARSLLNKRYPGFESLITQVSLAGLLGVNIKTIARDNERQHYANKMEVMVAKLRQFLRYPFESKVHQAVKKLDADTLVWASVIHKVIWDSREVERYSKMHFTWLPARLYPDAEWKSIFWISRLYILLFAMDDFSDRVPDGMKVKVWQEIEGGIVSILNGLPTRSYTIRIQAFCDGFADLWSTIGELAQVDSDYISMLKREVEIYLASNRWEAENRDNQAIPSLERYKYERPLFSGGNLSIALIPLGLNHPYSDTRKAFKSVTGLKESASKLIYLTNDLFSFEKEKQLNDFHNLVLLKMHHKKFSEHQSRDAVLRIHSDILEEFTHLANTVVRKNGIERELVSQLEYQVAGAVAWSLEDTIRYDGIEKQVNIQLR
ncbi:hypothetical protein J2X69_000033 [Algoriphagus sp. 4150]|uniref:terpene synthase family protein n=1 Tax=Algoriphagus sp. 4150 TaxID=2817756 RepID=UPI00285C24D6|nr:terpene synthase family protein [Algoriphagus sp. 4150]MDR7127705.1 hypothetical protein [Algoriphagus sp. 4150]